jgi:hypothetical protein
MPDPVEATENLLPPRIPLEHLTRDPDRWVDFMMRFELGLEEPEAGRALKSAFTIAGAYVVGGLIPLAPYFLLDTVSRALPVSILLTLAALLIFGGVKGQLTGVAPLRSALQTAIVLLLVVAFVGSVNPSGGSASSFVPVEHAVLTRETADAERTKAFARYSLVGGLASAGGALAAASPELFTRLHHRRAPGRDVPSIERPEMHAGPEPLANEAQPGNPGMGGFRHRSLHVEVIYRFRAASTLLGQPSPAGIAHARCAVAHRAVADEIDVDVFVGRPMALKIVEEGRPIELQVVPPTE